MRTIKSQREKKIFFDIVLILLINIGALIVFIKIDLFEKLYHLSREYESLQLDELIPLTFTLLISLIYFSYRRWRDNIACFSVAEQQASQDSLTKLFNRRSLESKIAIEWDRFLRYHENFCLVIFDIDDFKVINDTLGHVQGDRVLIEIANILHSNTRKTDACGRWGEEEFLILCPVCKKENAALFAEKLRSTLYRTLKDGVELSASFAVVESSNDETLEGLMKRAQFTLHKAKMRGKNCVVSG